MYFDFQVFFNLKNKIKEIFFLWIIMEIKDQFSFATKIKGNKQQSQYKRNQDKLNTFTQKWNTIFLVSMNTIHRKEKEVSSKETNVKLNARNINSSLNEKGIQFKETAKNMIPGPLDHEGDFFFKCTSFA